MTFRTASEIRGYHAHVYYQAATRDVAQRLHAELGARFVGTLGRMHDVPVGPHSVPMFQFAFESDELVRIVPWLMLNRGDLSVMIHPRTGDEVADHMTNPMWLGAPLAVNVEFLHDWVAAHAP